LIHEKTEGEKCSRVCAFAHHPLFFRCFFEEKKVMSIDYWTIERDGYVFLCKYDRTTDWVAVDCEGLGMSKGALGKNSGPILIAKILSGEILRECIRWKGVKEIP